LGCLEAAWIANVDENHHCRPFASGGVWLELHEKLALPAAPYRMHERRIDQTTIFCGLCCMAMQRMCGEQPDERIGLTWQQFME
jgi:hypothetical protein